MKLIIQTHLLFLVLLSATDLAHAQSTAFTYNGRLNYNGAMANGPHDMSFTLYDSELGVTVVHAPLPVSPVDVRNGLFTVRIDFGADVFTGPPRWLEVKVRPVGGGNYMTLTPRQEVTSSPYAIRAQTAGTAANVNVGTVVKSLNGLRDDLTLAAGANVTITPNGNTLTLAAAGAGGSGIWTVLNNNAYYSAGNVGLGTSTPAHRLSIGNNLPAWTTNNWGGAIELWNSAAIGWQANALGQRFGMGHTSAGFLMFRTASDPGTATAGSQSLTDFVIDNSGNVGIGTTSPRLRLDVKGQAVFTAGGNGGEISLAAPNGETGMTIGSTGNRADLRFDGVTLKLLAGNGVGPPPSVNGITINATSGNVGIGGSPFPVAKLEVVGQDALRLVGYQPYLQLLDTDTGYARSRIQGANGEFFFWTEGFLTGASPNGWAKISSAGNLSVATLTIRGGADLAEPFPMAEERIEKGSVVVIDDEHPGRLKRSTHAYDTRVAGIVSGANGINPGIALKQEGTLDQGENVALTGRVYVQADAAFGAIKPGDLLTTSGTPGHAMKVTDHAKAQGAILGKAMSGLTEGKGMVLVLVTLQ